MRAEAAFRDAMSDAGIAPPQNIVADGRLHRFDVNDDRRGTRTGWYILHLDNLPAGVFGCWKRGISEKWTEDRPGLSDAEREQQRERIAHAIRAHAADGARTGRLTRGSRCAVVARPAGKGVQL